jgi:hypothetical protein
MAYRLSVTLKKEPHADTLRLMAPAPTPLAATCS